MTPASLLQLLAAWLWINLAGAALYLFEAGAGGRFWLLLLAAASSWVSLHFFRRHLARRGA
ncbi:MAG: hypothetical protein ACK4QW_04075 [Alphaproteobacteria bacterium]